MPKKRNVPGLQLMLLTGKKKIGSWRLCIYVHKYWIGKTKESRRLKEKYEEHNPRRWVCVKVDKSVCWFEGESEKVRLSELKQAIWLGESLNACECDRKLWKTDKKKRCFEFQAALMESSAGIQMIIWRKIVWERERKKVSCSSVAWPKLLLFKTHMRIHCVCTLISVGESWYNTMTMWVMASSH